jgi:hypothetical protein
MSNLKPSSFFLGATVVLAITAMALVLNGLYEAAGFVFLGTFITLLNYKVEKRIERLISEIASQINNLRMSSRGPNDSVNL